jgi:hypothetical protein
MMIKESIARRALTGALTYIPDGKTGMLGVRLSIAIIALRTKAQRKSLFIFNG